MPAIIKTLHDITRDPITGEITGRVNVFPETTVAAVNMPDGRRTLLDKLDDISDESSVTMFNANGTITKTMTNSGMISVTTFGNGVITEICTYPDTTPYYTKTTTFNNDGSITVDKQYANNGG